MTGKLLKNGTVIAWDNQLQSIKVLENTSIRIDGETITEIAPAADMSSSTDTEVIDVTGMIITPGFINGHCHMWQTAFRSMAPDIFIAQYFGWLSQMGTATKSFTPSDIYLSCLEGYCEGLNAGVTSYVDHATANWSRDVVRPSYEAASDGGARVWWCHDLFPGDQDRLAMLGKIKSDIDADAHGVVSMGLAPDAYDWSNETAVGQMKSVVTNLKPEVITTHYLGGAWTVGRNSPSHAASQHLEKLDIPIIFSHAGSLTPSDISALRNSDFHICITPENEMCEGHGQKTSRTVHDHAALGTDTNWNISGDMVHSARLWLQSVRGVIYQQTLDKGQTPRANPMLVADAFLLATRQGGRALRRDDIGVIKVGAKADLVCFDGDSPNMVGWTNAVAAVVLHSNVGDVKHVLVNGEWRKRDGHLVTKTESWDTIRTRFAKVARRIQEENAHPPSLPDKFWGGGEYGDVESAAVT